MNAIIYTFARFKNNYMYTETLKYFKINVGVFVIFCYFRSVTVNYLL